LLQAVQDNYCNIGEGGAVQEED